MQAKIISIPPQFNIDYSLRRVCSPEKQCSASPTVIKSYFYSQLQSQMQHFQSVILGQSSWLSLYLLTLASATLIICSLISIPFTSLKQGRYSISTFPVPIPTSKNLSRLARLSIEFLKSQFGQAGRYWSYLKPWVEQHQISFIQSTIIVAQTCAKIGRSLMAVFFQYFLMALSLMANFLCTFMYLGGLGNSSLFSQLQSLNSLSLP